MLLCDKERVFLCDKERVFLCDKERVFFVDAKLHITNGKAAIYCLENRLPVLSCHPGTYYLCKEKCRYCPRIRGIGDHGKVQGHPPTFLGNTNTIGDPIHVPPPFGLPASGHTLRKPATQHQCRERAKECTSRPAESEKEKDQDGQVPGADDINKHKASFLELTIQKN